MPGNAVEERVWIYLTGQNNTLEYVPLPSLTVVVPPSIHVFHPQRKWWRSLAGHHGQHRAQWIESLLTVSINTVILLLLSPVCCLAGARDGSKELLVHGTVSPRHRDRRWQQLQLVETWPATEQSPSLGHLTASLVRKMETKSIVRHPLRMRTLRLREAKSSPKVPKETELGVKCVSFQLFSRSLQHWVCQRPRSLHGFAPSCPFSFPVFSFLLPMLFFLSLCLLFFYSLFSPITFKVPLQTWIHSFFLPAMSSSVDQITLTFLKHLY